MLATFTVNDLGDTNDANPGDGVAQDAAGNTTLRAAIEEANALTGADDIDFSVVGTVNLPLGALQVASDLTIAGAGNIAVDATGSGTRVMTIDDGMPADVTVELNGLTLTGGAAAQGGGIFNAENTTLRAVTVQGNTANAPDSTTAAFGGGVFNSGTMLITDQSLITGNQSLDAASPDFFNALGGGIANYGSDADLTVSNSTVSSNYTMHYGGGIVSLQGSVTINNGSTITQNATTNNGLFTSGAGVGLLSVFYSVDNGATPATITPTIGVGGFSLTVEDSTFSENVLTGGTFPYGGAIYGSGYGSVVINDSTFTGNRVDGGGGARGAAGFFYGNDGSALASGVGAPGLMTIDITNTLIDSNTAAEESGGFGFRSNLTNPIEMTITDSVISNNVGTAGDGGASLSFAADGHYANSSLTIENTTLSGNSSGGAGGAVSADSVDVTIINSTIDGNSSAGDGGGLYIYTTTLTQPYPAPTAQVIRSTISNNVADAGANATYGGGVHVYASNLLVDNSTISGNSATYGGGIYTGGNDSPGTSQDSIFQLHSSTITNNASDNGGGIFAGYYPLAEFRNSIISGNTATGSSPDVFQRPYYAPPSLYYSLVGDGTDSGLVDGTNGSLVGDAMNPVDAMLGALADNGGLTLSHLPMTGSPAIDAGDPSFMGGTDQTGGPRVNDGRIDMGSVETGMVPTIGPDFNGDGTANCDDINALSREINAAVPDLGTYDILTDGVLNLDDIREWLIQAGARAEYAAATNGNPFFRGDADLNGVVDGLDFIIWNTDKFESVDGMPGSPLGYCNGDFNGDNVVDGLDFIDWNTNKFKDSKVDPGAPNITLAGTTPTTVVEGERPTGRRQFLVRTGDRSKDISTEQVAFAAAKVTSVAAIDTDAVARDIAWRCGEHCGTTAPFVAGRAPGGKLERFDQPRGKRP